MYIEDKRQKAVSVRRSLQQQKESLQLSNSIQEHQARRDMAKLMEMERIFAELNAKKHKRAESLTLARNKVNSIRRSQNTNSNSTKWYQKYGSDKHIRRRIDRNIHIPRLGFDGSHARNTYDDRVNWEEVEDTYREDVIYGKLPGYYPSNLNDNGNVKNDSIANSINFHESKRNSNENSIDDPNKLVLDIDEEPQYEQEIFTVKRPRQLKALPKNNHNNRAGCFGQDEISIFARRDPTPRKGRSPKLPPPDLAMIEGKIANASSPEEKAYYEGLAKRLRRDGYWHGRVKPDFKPKLIDEGLLHERELQQIAHMPVRIGYFRRIHLSKLVEASNKYQQHSII